MKRLSGWGNVATGLQDNPATENVMSLQSSGCPGWLARDTPNDAETARNRIPLTMLTSNQTLRRMYADPVERGRGEGRRIVALEESRGAKETNEEDLTGRTLWRNVPLMGNKRTTAGARLQFAWRGTDGAC